MKRVLLLCFVLFSLAFAQRNPLDRNGILYVNEIVANSDTFTIQIEDSFVEDNILRIDTINEWTGNGVTSEGIVIQDGSVVLADDFVVNTDGTILSSQLNANGGIFADAGREDFSSFVVEDDTGRTTVRGVIFIQDGIFTPGDAFTVTADGDVTIEGTTFNAVGGIDVNGGSFSVSDAGDLFSASSLAVIDTFLLGSAATEDRYVTREFTAGQNGGDTVVSAQDGSASGGDLFIVPGVATDCADGAGCDDGSLFIGRQTNDNIVVGRPDVSGPAATTTYIGQDSLDSDGGDINLSGGDSSGSGNGGNLILVPGLSDAGTSGNILFGTPDGDSNVNLFIERPPLSTGNGGDTFFVGQDTLNGPAGDLYIQGGQGSNGGALFLTPGDASGNGFTQGDIILGDETAATLLITRNPSSGSGDVTLFEGQNSPANRGGDFFIRAGHSTGNGNGGNVVLLPGSNPAAVGVLVGDIVLGDLVENLVITRPARDGGGLSTTINGQGGDASQGGNLIFTGGQGNTLGGDTMVSGGAQTLDDGSTAVGGSVLVQAGDGQIDGGDIAISGGVNNVGTGSGDIDIGSTSATSTVPADVVFNAGSGDTLGDVVVGDFSDSFTLEGTPMVIENSYLLINDGADQVTFRADPTSIVQFNGKTLLRSVSDFPVPAVSTVTIAPINDPALSATAYRLSQLQNSVEILVNALSQCQHGLFETLDINGNVDSCDFD